MNYTNGIYLLIGSNLGNRIHNLKKSIELLHESSIQTIHQSAVYVSPAWGTASPNDYYNMVLEVRANIHPNQLLLELKAIEQKMGRDLRAPRYADRIIDLDILFYASELIEEENLVIPHPRIAERRFALKPLVEIAPYFIHPKLKLTMKELLDACQDTSDVQRVIDLHEFD